MGSIWSAIDVLTVSIRQLEQRCYLPQHYAVRIFERVNFCICITSKLCGQRLQK